MTRLDTDSTRTLGRSTLRRTRPSPPVRIVHLGLGAFCRSHTAWYTAAASDAADWGIAAYTGRSRDLADRLTSQGGLYTLVSRDAGGDRAETISSLSRTHAGDEVAALVQDIAAPATAIVTLTITEVGYRLGANDRPDSNDPHLARDLLELRGVGEGRVDLDDARPVTAPGRLLLGLEARRRGGAGPVAIVSCDNLPDNGGRLSRGLSAWSESAMPILRAWLDDNVSFVSSSVDRITPRISDEELRQLGETYGDAAPVVAEPFHDWVLSGDFPAGRPAWESAGARFVDELEPWEARKLWLLNGAHTLLACFGPLRGHQTVAEAISDPVCRSAVEDLWDDAEHALPDGLDLLAYRAALLERFGNPRIEHRLLQIAQDSQTKVRLRIVPIAERGREARREASGAAFALAAWIAAEARGVLPGVAGDAGDVRDRIASISAPLASDVAYVEAVHEALAVLG